MDEDVLHIYLPPAMAKEIAERGGARALIAAWDGAKHAVYKDLCSDALPIDAACRLPEDDLPALDPPRGLPSPFPRGFVAPPLSPAGSPVSRRFVIDGSTFRELRAVARRADRSLSFVAQRAWERARGG